MRKLGKLPVGHCIDLRTYKRNRSLLILNTGNGCFRIHQNGYENAIHEAAPESIRKILKTLFKKEFPRSNKIRIYELGQFTDSMLDREMKKL
ncbi:hypothetical protein [Maridesulfovibrio sp.]|uniref:hypothetical protein n=1 Tax=Maridesulfovibrio sp. TaxID=2795000 RepID=UPI002A1893A2|nr:hypothetical protein [Maridesulfovibrio sp.]